MTARLQNAVVRLRCCPQLPLLVDDATRSCASGGTMPRVALQTSDYRDPGAVVDDIMRRHDVSAGDIYLALVREPHRAQDVVHTTYVPRDAWIDLDRHELSEFICEKAQAMPVPDWREQGSPRHSITTVVFRRGLTVFGAGEALWLDAWMFSNHLMCAFSGGMILVTEHGWADFMSDLGATTPALRVLPERV